MIFGRTALRIGGSKAKFDVQAHGDVHFAAASPKPYKIIEKLIFRSGNFADLFFSTLKNEMLEIAEPCLAEVS